MLEGYSDGPIYGTTTLTFDIVPTNVTEEDFSCTTTANSARLSWKPSLGATHYIVYQNIGGTWTRLGIVGKPEYTVTGLGQGSYQSASGPLPRWTARTTIPPRIQTLSLLKWRGDPSALSRAARSPVPMGTGPSPTPPAWMTAPRALPIPAAMKPWPKWTPTLAKSPSWARVPRSSQRRKTGVTGQYRLTVLPITVGLEWIGTEERVYDGQPSNVTATATGLLGDDTAPVTVTGDTEKDAGEHTATATSLDNKNYALPEEASVSYTITPKPITTLTWSDMELTYTGQPQAPTASSEEVVAGDTVEFFRAHGYRAWDVRSCRCQ